MISIVTLPMTGEATSSPLTVVQAKPEDMNKKNMPELRLDRINVFPVAGIYLWITIAHPLLRESLSLHGYLLFSRDHQNEG